MHSPPRPGAKATQAVSVAQALPRITGVQSVDRALAVVQVLATHGRRGMPLGAIAACAGLDPATARRLLIALTKRGFADQDAVSRRYFVGTGLFSIAAAAANQFDLSESRRAMLLTLCRSARATSAFYVRDGDDVVCIDLVQQPGGARISGVGERRPIGAEPFGLSVLAALPEDEGESIVIRNVRRYARNPEQAIKRVGVQLRACRKRGFAAEADPDANRWTGAVSITDRDGRPDGALGIAVGLAGLSQSDLRVLLATLRHEARNCQHALWHVPPVARGPAKGEENGLEELLVSHGEISAGV